MFEIVLIDPLFSQVKCDRGDDLKDAIASFKSSVWEQGWGAGERVMREYGDWSVYRKQDDNSLKYLGKLKNL
jgi:hypothetical protein